MKRNIKRMAVTFLVVTLGLGILLGNVVYAQKVTIEVWDKGGTSKQWMQEIAGRFMEANPDIKLVVKSIPDYWTKTTLAFNTKTEPDVLQHMGHLIAPFVRQGLVDPVPDSVMTMEEAREFYWPVALKYWTYQDKFYGMQASQSTATGGFVINTELVKEAGLEIPSSWIEDGEPGSLKELLDFAKKLTLFDAKGKMLRAGLAIHSADNVFDFLSVVVQCGGDYWDEENVRVNFNTPEAERALEILKRLVLEEKVDSMLLPRRYVIFQKRQAAMCVIGLHVMSVLPRGDPSFKGNLLYLRMPTLAGDTYYYAVSGGAGLVVSARSKNKEAAWKFLNVFKEEESVKSIIRYAGWQTPVKKYCNPEFYAELGRSDLRNWFKNIPNGFDMASYMPDPGQFAFGIVAPEIELVLLGEKTVKQALADMTTNTNEMIKELTK